MKRKITFFITILLVCLTTSCNKETSTTKKEGLIEPEPYNLIDKVMVFFGNHDKSVEYCKYACGLDQVLGFKGMSMHFYNYVIENDPEFWFAHYRKGLLELYCKSYERSYNDLMKAYQLMNDTDFFEWAFSNKSYVCMSLGDCIINYVKNDYNERDSLFETKQEAYLKAIEFYEEALFINRLMDGDIKHLYYVLAFAYADAGFYNEAKEKVKKCQSYSVDFLNGYICELQGEFSMAIVYYEGIVTRYEDCDDVLLRLANCYEKLGDEENAVTYMKKAASVSNKVAINWLKERNIKLPKVIVYDI